MRYFILILLLIAKNIFAAPVTVTWDWPTTYCDDSPIDQVDFAMAKIIYHTEPLPMTSDDYGPCFTPVDGRGPEEAITINLSTDETSYILDLTPGQVYYIRIRVCYNRIYNCSNWSNQVEYMAAWIPLAPILIEF